MATQLTEFVELVAKPQKLDKPRKRASQLWLLLLSPFVILTRGYYPFADDASIYVTGVLKIASPSLFQADAELFLAHTHFSVFSYVIAYALRVTQLSVGWMLLLLHFLSALLFFVGTQMLARRLFVSEKSRWGVVVMAGACFTLPVAGTTLSLMDPYVTARSGYASNLGDQATLAPPGAENDRLAHQDPDSGKQTKPIFYPIPNFRAVNAEVKLPLQTVREKLTTTAHAQESWNSTARDSSLPNAPQPVQVTSQPGEKRSSQTDTGNISGTVLDTNGDVLQGAKIILAAQPSSSIRTAVSGSDGQFAFTGLPPDVYRITVTAPGMNRFTSPRIPLQAGEVRFVPAMRLSVSGGSTSVTVNGNKEELAKEQVQIAVQQRVGGVSVLEGNEQ